MDSTATRVVGFPHCCVGVYSNQTLGRIIDAYRPAERTGSCCALCCRAVGDANLQLAAVSVRAVCGTRVCRRVEVRRVNIDCVEVDLGKVRLESIRSLRV